MSIYLAMVISLAAGTVVGALMGLIVTKLRVQSFIATLGMQYALAGVVLLLTNSSPFRGFPRSLPTSPAVYLWRNNPSGRFNPFYSNTHRRFCYQIHDLWPEDCDSW